MNSRETGIIATLVGAQPAADFYREHGFVPFPPAVIKHSPDYVLFRHDMEYEPIAPHVTGLARADLNEAELAKGAFGDDVTYREQCLALFQAKQHGLRGEECIIVRLSAPDAPATRSITMTDQIAEQLLSQRAVPPALLAEVLK